MRLQEINAYIQMVKPDDHQDGRKLLKEGLEIGKNLERPVSRFLRESGYKSYLDYKKHKMANGEITWNILLGLANLDEQIEGGQILYERAKEKDYDIDSLQPIPSGLIALKPEDREDAPLTTSFVMDGLVDYNAQTESIPVEVAYNDYHIAAPSCLETTKNSLLAGASIIGEVCQFLWSYTGEKDTTLRFEDMIRSLGMVASKYDEDVMVKTYLDDAYAGYFVDAMSYVAYAMVEHYICTTLCGARFIVAYGGLLTEPTTRMGIAIALDRILSTEEQPVLHYINGSTTPQWDNYVEANYGVSVPEMLFEILTEKHYRMGLGINPVSITEKIRVPNVDELTNIFFAGKRTEEQAEAWMPFMNFELLDEIADVMVENAKIMFGNTMTAFKNSGVDIKDPLEMILLLRNFSPLKFEQCFHPSTYGNDEIEVHPFYPTELGSEMISKRNDIISDLQKKWADDTLNGYKIVIGSADTHTYGLLLVEGVLKAMGAEVVNGGVDLDTMGLLDLADEEETPFAGISVHNGQALGYAALLKRLEQDRQKKYFLFMGGVLNSILEGDSEPTIVKDQVNELGVIATNDFDELIEDLLAFND